MNKLRIVLLSLMLASTGCASERLYVKVVDDEGNSVSNAVVNVSFTSGRLDLVPLLPSESPCSILVPTTLILNLTPSAIFIKARRGAG